jgi:hypothetical protein
MMPFGLQNAGATNQQCMQDVFKDHMGRTVEAYVDVIVVKTKKSNNLVNNLHTAFNCLWANGVKLNPENASSGCRVACCWDTLFPSEASSPTPKQSQPSTGWAQFETLKGCRRCWGALPP